MAMGIVSKESFEEEVNSNLIVRDLIHGRNGAKAVPESIKEVIAIESLLGASNQELIDEFGLSQSSISAYKNGANSTSSYNEKNENLSKVINDVSTKLRAKAQEKLDNALDSIDLKDRTLSARDKSAIAKDMSVVFRNLEETKDNNVNVLNQQVIVYKPRMKEEEDYQVIEVQE
jgi:predicted transcriptional regulator